MRWRRTVLELPGNAHRIPGSVKTIRNKRSSITYQTVNIWSKILYSNTIPINVNSPIQVWTLQCSRRCPISSYAYLTASSKKELFSIVLSPLTLNVTSDDQHKTYNRKSISFATSNPDNVSNDFRLTDEVWTRDVFIRNSTGWRMSCDCRVSFKTVTIPTFTSIQTIFFGPPRSTWNSSEYVNGWP